MAILPTMLVISKLIFFLFHISYAADTITQFQSLPDDGSTFVSKNGTFELGFFNPVSSSNRYVGIWYKNIPVRTVVWVANRDNPIKDNSSQLIISNEGNLVLLSQNKTLLWSTNSTTEASSTIVQLLDTGNLVLVDEKGNNNETSFLWQSFDHPCDTLLPGQRIGWDLKTGLDRRLTAWKNWDDPSSGDLTLSIVHTSNPEIVTWRGLNMLYRSGPWNGIGFSYTLAFRPDDVFVHKFVSKKEEAYYTYTLEDSSVISRFVLNQIFNGSQRLIWKPESRNWSLYDTWPTDQCDVYNFCGSNGQCSIDISPICQCLEGFKLISSQSYNPRQGCVRSEPWSCGVKNRDGFRRFAGIKMPDTTNSWVNENMTLEECKAKCLENCSCTAYANTDIRGAGSGCSIWFGDLLDLTFSQGDLYVRMANSSDTAVSADAHHGRQKKIVLVVTITVLLVLVMLLAFSYIYVTKTKHKEETEKTILMEDKDEGEQEDLELPLYDLATIVRATNNFSIDNKLGQGGFGPVFKGTLLDGQEIAVKRLSRSSGQGSIEFKNEVILCAKLQHRNLVKVLGCCIEGEEKMLLYEYMPNKSLDSFLFDSAQSKLLDWTKRLNILCSIARGLLYLHQDSRLRIIHRDLKASNILLDKDMNPKISDFGMARMCGGDQIEGNTNRIVGTYGYMAPEYANDGLFSIKSDVFSFGVLLLEIVSGKKNKALIYHDPDYNLIGHAWRLWKEGIPDQLIDMCLGDSCIVSEALRCIQIGLLCLQHHPDIRPNMTSVVVMLSGENALPQPKEPGFLIKKVSIEGEHSPESQVSSSHNEVTISVLNAR